MMIFNLSPVALHFTLFFLLLKRFSPVPDEIVRQIRHGEPIKPFCLHNIPLAARVKFR